jgi:thiol-disulfide isomerase/thioredoxin
VFSAGAAPSWARRLPFVFLAATGVFWLSGCDSAGPAHVAESEVSGPASASAASKNERPQENVVEPAAPESNDAEVNPETISEVSVDVSHADEARMAELLRDAEGKILVVNVWATWCLPCIAEMPVLSTFYKEMDTETTAFLSLSADGSFALEETVIPFAKARTLPFPVFVLDFKDPDPLILASMLGVSETGWDGVLPATFLFDRERKLARHWFEEVKPGELEAAIKTAAGELSE